MKLQGITTQPDPYKPYLLSQAIKSGPFVFVSGHLVPYGLTPHSIRELPIRQGQVH